MPRNGSGVYSADWVNAAPNTTIESAKQNAMVADLVADANAARPITAGGTGATTAAGARTALSVISSVVQQVFSASGTYTPTSSMVYCIVEAIGGGGGGGGAKSAVGSGCGGGGGGSGSYSRRRLTAAEIGASQTVTIGAAGAAGTSTPGAGGNGGDTSVGTLVVAKGGTGGGAASTATAGAGGAGGSTAGAGTILAAGNGGAPGTAASIATVQPISGEGAASFLGGGASGKVQNNTGGQAGNAGSNYGAGGAGGVEFNQATGAAGGAGAPGYVIVTEFIG